jgi:hypothetical protein
MWVLGALLGLAGLLVALFYPKRYVLRTERAFEQLEDDWARFQEQARSDLGRISRLKREVQSKDRSTTGGDGVDAKTPTVISTPSKQLTRSQLLSNWRRNHDEISQRPTG